MSSPSTQLATLRGMSIYEPFHHITMWEDTFKDDGISNTGPSTVLQVETRLDNKPEYISHESEEHSRSDQETNNPPTKIQRRLAQNREAARKSRLRKKAYVQQLESSRLKLAQLEQELERCRQQGLYVASASNSSQLGFSGTVNPGIVAFEMQYAHWVEEQQKQIRELRNALQAPITDIELQMLVENALNHYNKLCAMKADAAKADVFYLVSGTWRTSAERFFHWIGGFRPSELLHVTLSSVLMPQLEPLTEQQHLEVCNLRQSSQQAEDALSQGIEKLQQSLVQSTAIDLMGAGSYDSQMIAAMEKLEGLEGFANQADHLRQQTLQQMSRILTVRQSARGLLALGEYFHRLRALSSIWTACPHEPA
ncbi:transcription factor TGA7 isoform X1 [Tripterygium wilfordii]|uniref:transcription factor TGA7 isoform X1 n=1 Tax=Tripterygium wilfordii TaxID=458696 RepID=UPI0018F843CF|nr:transcription factor TGA7 isoform X1 [Tripterygium wilfordii]XP_038703543.1 transcription factor TGA7 isoform X1 [Tripterygium wilfordii]